MEMKLCDREKQDYEILTFKNGILGFEDIKEYRLFFLEDGLPFFYLQAAGNGGHPCFVVCDPVYFIPDYKVGYDEEILRELDADNAGDLRCIAIATVPERLEDITVNLKSPVVINVKNNQAKQFVLDCLDYPIRHRLFKRNGAVG